MEYGYGFGGFPGGCCPQPGFVAPCGSRYGYAIILVLFILLVIIGTSRF